MTLLNLSPIRCSRSLFLRFFFLGIALISFASIPKGLAATTIPSDSDRPETEDLISIDAVVEPSFDERVQEPGDFSSSNGDRYDAFCDLALSGASDGSSGHFL